MVSPRHALKTSQNPLVKALTTAAAIPPKKKAGPSDPAVGLFLVQSVASFREAAGPVLQEGSQVTQGPGQVQAVPGVPEKAVSALRNQSSASRGLPRAWQRRASWPQVAAAPLDPRVGPRPSLRRAA